MADYKLIGKDLQPPDIIAKVTGQAKFAEDFRAEGMLFAKLLASPMPHARVRRIDADAALAMDGVIDILTADELPSVEAPGEAALTNEPRYQGEPVLAVAAVDETTAADAIDRIDVDFERLPFVLDPLDSLRPGGADARSEGNVYVGREIERLKWTEADFAGEAERRFPMGEAPEEWEAGDLEAGFAEAELIIEQPLVHQSVTHHPLEPRSCMAYWQNGKLYMHDSTQSVAQTRAGLARDLDLDLDDVVLISQFCGGGFGSKIRGSAIEHVPALLARKTGRPVMLRVTRDEETAFGRARAGLQGWARIGFRADGRVTALDLFLVQENGPYSRQGDFLTASSVASLSYQPLAMRFRGVAVLTNTPPKSAQRGPGGAQITAMLEPLMDKAANSLGMDRLEIRRINVPGHDARFGSNQSGVTSAFAREAIDKAAELFGWEEKKALSRQRRGSKVTGIGVGFSSFVAGSTGYDGLLLIRPEDGKLYVHQGIGNLGSHSCVDTSRAAAEVLGVAWENCVPVWGDTSKHLPWSSSQSGSQTTHAHTRANHAAALDVRRKLQEIAAMDLGGAPDDYDVGEGRVFRRSTPASGMDFARAAERAQELGGRYDGHEHPDDINDMTVTSVRALAGQGLIGVARDNFPRDGSTYAYVVGFARIELDLETGVVEPLEYTAVADCGTILNRRSLGGQILGGSIQGMGMARSERWIFDPQWGTAGTKRFYTAKPPTILDVPRDLRWAAVDEPDPQTPVGSKGIGEAPVGAGAATMVSAIMDALGGEYLGRTPVTADKILTFLEGREQPYAPFATHV